MDQFLGKDFAELIESGPDFRVFSVFHAKGPFEGKNGKNCLSSVAHKT